MIDLRPFQKRFIKGAFAPGIRRAALCLSRGQGKSTLAAHILQRCLTEGDTLNVPGAEYILLAQSLEGAKLVFQPLREALGDGGDYRYAESTTRMSILHKASGTSLRVISSKGKSAMGLGARNPLVIADEVGSWEVNSLMHDALEGALGKPDSDMRIIYLSTLAPEGVEGHWWHSLVTGGSTDDTFVMSLRGDLEKWDQASEIRRVNPLKWHYPASRKTLLAERDKAREDPRLKAFFCSYWLNAPSRDESETLLTLSDWQLAVAREPGSRDGQPIVGLDMGQNRAWCGAIAIYPSGLIDAVAMCPGIPSIEQQERRDIVDKGSYAKLVHLGLLRPADDLRVPEARMVLDMILEQWGKPSLLISDRARAEEVKDAIKGRVKHEVRVTRWFQAADDVRALRKCVKDGPFSVNPDARLLIEASLAVAKIKNDDQGSFHLVKNGTANKSRDDIAAALTLGAGAWTRKPVRSGLRSLGLAG